MITRISIWAKMLQMTALMQADVEANNVGARYGAHNAYLE